MRFLTLRAAITTVTLAVLCIATSLLLISTTVTAAGETYYVDATNGNDSNTGLSEGQAWQTLAKVNTGMTGSPIITAGTTVLFKRGETFTGILNIRQSGTSGNVIRFADYGTGAKPIINGSGQARAIDARTNLSYFVIENLTVTGGSSQNISFSSSISNVTLNNLTLGNSTTGLFIATGTFSNITLSNSSVDTVTNGVSVSTLTSINGLYISNLTATNYSAKAVVLSIGTSAAYSNLTLTDSTLTGGTGGYELNIASGTTLNGLTVSNTTISGVTTGRGLRVLKTSTGSVSNISVSSSTFENNLIGCELSFATSTASNVTLTDDTFHANTGTNARGLLITGIGGTLTNVDLDNLTATNNAGGIEFSGTSTGTLSDVTINNVTATGSTTGAGLAFTNSFRPSWLTGLEITNSTFSNNAVRGLTIESGDNVVISDTTANNNGTDGVAITYASDTVDISNLSANDNGGSGISFSSSSTDLVNNVTVSNATLTGNTSNGLSIVGDGSNYLVEDSEASDNGNDGFNAHDGASGLIFRRTTANDNGWVMSGASGDGYSFHDTVEGIVENSIARNNRKSAVTHIQQTHTITRNNVFTHTTSGVSPLVDFYGTDGPGGLHEIYNNTLYSASNQGIGIQIADYASGTITNNIVQGFATGISFVDTNGAVMTEDYNLLYDNTTNWSGITPGSHSFVANPLFTDIDSLDLTLQSGSPAIDAGKDTSLSEDLLGKSRYDMPTGVNTGAGTSTYYDIGAYEHIQPAVIMSSTDCEDGQWCNTKDITLSPAGTSPMTTYTYLLNQVSNPSLAAVQAGTYDADGVVQLDDSVILEDGVYYFHILPRNTAESLSGDTYTTYTLKVDTAGPVITLQTPLDNQETTLESIQLSAQLTDSLSGVSNAQVNGSNASVTADSLSLGLPLAQGSNSFTISATDNANNSSSLTFSVQRNLAALPTNPTSTPTPSSKPQSTPTPTPTSSPTLVTTSTEPTPSPTPTPTTAPPSPAQSAKPTSTPSVSTLKSPASASSNPHTNSSQNLPLILGSFFVATCSGWGIFLKFKKAK